MHGLPAHKAADGTNEWHLTARRHINETLATRMPSRAWAATQGDRFDDCFYEES
jgi:hypothetical protein